MAANHAKAFFPISTPRLFILGFLTVFVSFSKVMMTEANFPTFHLLATYHPVEGYFMSRMIAQALATFLKPYQEKREQECVREVIEYSLGNHTFDARTLADADWPVVIRGAFDAGSNPAENLMAWLGNTRGNLFSPCEQEPEAVLGKEVRPCLNMTLEEKIVGARDPLRRRGFAHNLVLLKKEDIQHHTSVLENMWGTHPEITHIWEHSQIVPHTNIAVASQQSLVNYYHAHLDLAVVWNMHGTKHWSLLHPDYLPDTLPVWSGNALLGTRTPQTKCVVETVQKPGDVLIMPPWWLHATRLLGSISENQIRSIGYNQHLTQPGSIFGPVVSFLENMLGPKVVFETMSPMVTPNVDFFNAVAKAASAV